MIIERSKFVKVKIEINPSQRLNLNANLSFTIIQINYLDYKILIFHHILLSVHQMSIDSHFFLPSPYEFLGHL